MRNFCTHLLLPLFLELFFFCFRFLTYFFLLTSFLILLTYLLRSPPLDGSLLITRGTGEVAPRIFMSGGGLNRHLKLEQAW